jgi:hypothetical protein
MVTGCPVAMIETERAKSVPAVKRRIDKQLYTADKSIMVFVEAKAMAGDMASGSPNNSQTSPMKKKTNNLKKSTKSAVTRRVGTHQRAAQARTQARRDQRGGGR